MAVESADNRGRMAANDSYDAAHTGAVGLHVSPSGAEPGAMLRECKILTDPRRELHLPPATRGGPMNARDVGPLSVLRIYLRRRSIKQRQGFWGRLLGRSLSLDLVERALKAGVPYATVTLGHAGFLPGATRLVADSEAAPTTLPSCVELVGPADMLDAFVTANLDELTDAVIFRLDGARVTLRGESP